MGAGLLRKLAIDRPDARAWALYDWANSAVFTTVITAVFPIYWRTVAASGLDETTKTEHFSLAVTLTTLAVAALSPFLGSIADQRAAKKRLLAIFVAVGAVSTASLFRVGDGAWLVGLVLFSLVRVGASGANVFYDALLPHVARDGETDRLSTTGYALGYLGGGLLLGLNLAWIERPGWFGIPTDDPTLPSRLAFVSVAVWWAAFAWPLLRRVPEPAALATVPVGNVLTSAHKGLVQTLRELRRYPAALWMLVAFLVYNDGILTIIGFATTFGVERGFGRGVMIGAILMVQFVGVPCAVGFGWLASRFGAKRSLYGALAVYAVIAMLAFAMDREWHFLVLAFLVALVQGGSQALSRSLFASLVPKEKSGEFFGIFGVCEKFASVLGPLAVWSITLATGDSRWSLFAIAGFFVVGALLLAKVDVEAGRAALAERGSPLLRRDPDPSG